MTTDGVAHLLIITRLQFDPLAIVAQADQLQSGLPSRSEGLHLSQIYQDIDLTLARKKQKPMEQGELNAYRAVGFIWEHILGDALSVSLGSDDWVRPGEMACDGIIGSPDLFDLGDGSVVETKATYRTFRKMQDDAQGIRDEFWLWAVQMKGYCHMMGTRTSKLYALFVNGDYTKYSPVFRAWQFEWSQQELTENWRMLTDHAKRRGWL